MFIYHRLIFMNFNKTKINSSNYYFFDLFKLITFGLIELLDFIEVTYIFIIILFEIILFFYILINHLH